MLPNFALWSLYGAWLCASVERGALCCSMSLYGASMGHGSMPLWSMELYVALWSLYEARSMALCLNGAWSSMELYVANVCCSSRFYP
eukprot:1151168-Pelagomonas_calceolata.AAC.5